MQRRSIRLSKRLPVQETQKNSTSDSSISEYDDGDESDYAKRQTKRQRKSSNLIKVKDRASGGIQTKTRRGPSIIESMPVDVIFETMSYLRPQDMLMLARTNHTFRNHLMSHNAQLLWKRARDVVDAPRPPPECSEPKWANLLYGGTKCQYCGTKGIIRVDFGLCRRLCNSCLKEHLVRDNKFPNRFPDYDTDVLDLIPYTNIGAFAHGHCCKSKYYWEDDIHAMVERLASFQKDIRMWKPNAKNALADFKEERMDVIARTQDLAWMFRKWHQAVHSLEKSQKRIYQTQRKLEIIDAFKEMGYQGCDIQQGIDHMAGLSANDKPMTAGVWTKTKKMYEPLIISYRDERLLPARLEALKPVYDAWVKTLRPEQWLRIPSLKALCLHPNVKAAFHSDKDVESPTTAGYADLSDRFSDLCSDWQTSMMSVFNEMKITFAENNKQSPVVVSDNLAVVRCNCCLDISIGIDEWFAHTWACRIPVDPFPETSYFRRLSRYICAGQVKYLESLITSIGKNPNTTTPSELDDLDQRFYCIACERGDSKTAYTWRQYVIHTGVSSWRHQAYLVTDPGELQLIEEKESDLHADNWGCAHCSEFYLDAENLSVIKAHLLREHSIEDPTERRDYLWDMSKSRYTYGPATVDVQSPERFDELLPKLWKCCYCADYKTIDEGAIIDHLITWHGDLVLGFMPIEPHDYKHLEQED